MVGTVQKIILGAADRASRNKCGDLHQLSQPQGKKKLVVSGDCEMGWCHVGALVGVIG
jgi:hypothetical protein